MRLRVFILSIVFNFLLFSSGAFASTYLNVTATGMVQPGANVTILGSIGNTSVSDVIAGVNVSATLNSSSNSQVTGADGNFNFNVSAPSTNGWYNVTISTNESTPKSKTITIFVSNITGGAINFQGQNPPFDSGATFTINASLTQDGSALQNYYPNIMIFEANGPPNGSLSGWVIKNLTPSSGSNGYMAWNITIPSSADGIYVIVLDGGALWKIFSIRAGYVISTSTETTSGELSFYFAPGSNVSVLAKVRDTNGNPATASSVVAYITHPNGTITNITLNSHPSLSGVYNNTFPHTNEMGKYSVKVEAVINGKTITGNTFFEVNTWKGSLETERDFFFEWGGQAAFEAGGPIKLNIVPVNLSDDSIINAGTGVWPACNTTYLKFVDLFFANGTSINSTITDASFSQNDYLLDNVCKVQFTGPSETGIYGLKINATIGGVEKTIEGYFSIQKYFLKANAVNTNGGSEDFMSMVAPGSNVTFELTAYNITNQTQVSGALLSGIKAVKIVPLEFTAGARAITNVTYTPESGASPKIHVLIPENVLGPTLVEIEATIGGESVRGNAFVVSNYIGGFLMPRTGQGGGGPPFSSCTGVVTFGGSATDVAAGSAAQGVTINSIIEAREELTGRDIKDTLSISGSTASDSQGRLTVNITFSNSESYSGFYFMLLNATYQGKFAGLPAGFMCKRLNFWPRISPLGGDEGYRIAPSSPVVLSIYNASRLNDSINILDGNLSFPMVMNFNPSAGGAKMLRPTQAFAAQVNVMNASGTPPNNQNNITLTLYPQNFTVEGIPLTQWPNGFIDLQPRICSGSIDGACDTGFGGFQVVPFDAWVENWNWGAQVSAGQTLVYNVSARTNVSNSSLGFTIKIGRPWEGQMTPIALNSWTLLEDGWNSSSDTGFERWEINFTIPTAINKGDAQLLITVNNTANQQTDMDLWLTITKYNVKVPFEEGIYGMDGYFVPVVDPQNNVSGYGWNMSYIEENYGVNSSSNAVCVKNNLTAVRFTSGGSQTILYSANTRVMLVDRFAPSTYDTLLLNESGTIKVINTTQRNFTPIDGSGALYLWSIEDCGFARIVNTSASAMALATDNYAGDHQVGVQFSVPYVVTLSNAPVSGFTVDLNGIAKEGDGGWGFEAKLVEGTNYTKTAGTTDGNGVGFVRVNITSSGRMILFWKVNDSSDVDIATMSTASRATIRRFKTWGEPVYPLLQGIVTLQYFPNSPQPVWNAFDPGAVPYVYNGTVQESSANSFVRDNSQDTWYIVFAPLLNLTKMDSDSDLSDVNPGFTNNTIWPGSGSVQLAITNFTRNTTPSGNWTFVYFQDQPTANSPATVSSGAENVTVKVCAQGYEKPNGVPKEGASILLYVTDYFTFPPTQKYVQMYDPLTGEAITLGESIKAGPFGCAAIKIGPGQLGEWPSAQTSWIEGDVSWGGYIEKVWAGGIFRP